MNENVLLDWQNVERRAVSLIDKGHMFQQLGDDAKALVSFNKAITICRPLREKSEPIAVVLSQALDNAANAMMDLGRIAEAIPVFDEAIQVQAGCIWGEETSDAAREAAITVMNKGRAHMLLDQDNEAHECFKLAERYLAEYGLCDEYARLRLNLGELFFRQDRFAAAVEEYDRGLFWWELFYREDLECYDPDDPKSDFTYTLYCKAEALLRLGRPQEALEASDRSVALQRDVVRRVNRAREWEGLADALIMRGKILNELGQTKEAQKSFREAARFKKGTAGNE